MPDPCLMLNQVLCLGFWVLAVGLCLSATDGNAKHLQNGSSSVELSPLATFAKAAPSTQRGKRPGTEGIGPDTRRRSGEPSPNARFLRLPDCGVGCQPPGQLLDFGPGIGSGPPGNLPAPPGPPVIVTPLPQSAGLLIAGLTILAALAARRRQRDAG